MWLHMARLNLDRAPAPRGILGKRASVACAVTARAHSSASVCAQVDFVVGASAGEASRCSSVPFPTCCSSPQPR